MLQFKGCSNLYNFNNNEKIYAWIKHTNTSNMLYPTDKVNIINNFTPFIDLKTLAIKDNTICPALIFAINRTVSVKGRIIKEIDSITTKNGIKTLGAPDGTKWAKVFFTEKFTLLITTNIHIIKASLEANHSELDMVYVIGVNPNKFMLNKK